MQNESTLVPNEVYDVIRATAAKLEGLAAYEKYAQNGNSELWEAMKTQDEEAVKQLLGELERLADDGKFSDLSSAASASKGKRAASRSRA